MIKSEREREHDYIRAAVDNMRRASLATNQAAISTKESHGEFSFKLAHYTHAIKFLFKERTRTFVSPEELRTFINDMADLILGGNHLTQTFNGLNEFDVNTAINYFMGELVEIFNNATLHDSAETLALIEYRMRYIRPFYQGGDRRITEAIFAYFSMRKNQDLPRSFKPEQMRRVSSKLPDTEDAQSNLEQIIRDQKKLKNTSYYQEWVDCFRSRFVERERKTEPLKYSPDSPWQVKQSIALDYESTTYNIQNVSRDQQDIDLLREATGERPENVVVFRPMRMALHEVIAASVTKISMEFPTEFIQKRILGPGNLFEVHIVPKIMPFENSFDNDKKIIEQYVDYILDDHFYVDNPNMEIRNEIEVLKELVLDKANEMLDLPRIVDARKVFLYLITDEILRQRYLGFVKGVVDEIFRHYLVANPDLALPLKKDSERLAWMTVGGPASGKSSLDNLIVHEFKKFLGNNHSICQINSDHYKALLLPKLPDDFEHGSRTYWESGQVRRRIMDRLRIMIEHDRLAPDYWVSTMIPSDERMRVVGSGGAKVNVYVVTCPVEGENGALHRALLRAKQEGHEDYQRFMSYKDILTNHKLASELLPRALSSAGRDLRLFNTETRPNVLIASMDSYNRELKVFDPKAFIDFVKKSLINLKATSDEMIYDDPMLCNSIAKEICRYMENNICLNFRYGQGYYKNSTLDAINYLPSDEVSGSTKKMMLDVQPESYAWFGHGRANIRDFSMFSNSLGYEQSLSLVIELGIRWPLTIQNYDGKIIFSVDKNNGLINYVTKASDAGLQEILNKAGIILNNQGGL